MKLQAIKQAVFNLTCTTTTQQLKQAYPQLAQGRDLRYKDQWLHILERLQTDQDLNISLVDLEQSEHMLRQSLLTVSQLAGQEADRVELEWQRIRLEAQFGDVHIEEL